MDAPTQTQLTVPRNPVDPDELWRRIRADRQLAAARDAGLHAQQSLALGFDGALLVVPPRPELDRSQPTVPESPQEVTGDLWCRQEQLALALERHKLPKKAQRHRECNSTWNTYACGDCGCESYSAIATCKLRTCVSCQRRYAKRWAAQVRERVEAATAKARSGWRLRLITLTVATHGTSDMARAITLIGEALPKLYRKVLRAKGAGAFFAVEAGELAGNIHVHGLYWGPWVDQRELSAEWFQLTGAVVVDVRLARGRGNGKDAIGEVCKYVCSPTLDVEIQAQLEAALVGKRRIRTYGIFRATEHDDDDEEHLRRCPHCQSVCIVLASTVRLSVVLPAGPSG